MHRASLVVFAVKAVVAVGASLLVEPEDAVPVGHSGHRTRWTTLPVLVRSSHSWACACFSLTGLPHNSHRTGLDT